MPASFEHMTFGTPVNHNNTPFVVLCGSFKYFGGVFLSLVAQSCFENEAAVFVRSFVSRRWCNGREILPGAE